MNRDDKAIWEKQRHCHAPMKSGRGNDLSNLELVLQAEDTERLRWTDKAIGRYTISLACCTRARGIARGTIMIEYSVFCLVVAHVCGLAIAETPQTGHDVYGGVYGGINWAPI